MHAFKTISLLALVGMSVALPRPGFDGWSSTDSSDSDVDQSGPGGFQGRPGGPGGPGGSFAGFQNGRPDHDDDDDDHSGRPVYEDVVVTATATVTYDGHYGGGYSPPTGAPSSGGYQGGSHEGSPAAPSEPDTTPAPSTGTSTGYMAIVDEWRSKLGLKQLTHDSGLEANALKTAQDGNGKMKHQLIGKTMAQVLAPGSASEFEHVFVGGWLCERPSMAGLNGVCAEQSKGWSYGGQTGHADILVSKAYSKIGCAVAGGIWSCDLA